MAPTAIIYTAPRGFHTRTLTPAVPDLKVPCDVFQVMAARRTEGGLLASKFQAKNIRDANTLLMHDIATHCNRAPVTNMLVFPSHFEPCERLSKCPSYR